MKKIFSLFAAVLFAGSMMAETVDFSAQGYSNQQAIESYAGENFSITFSKGSNSNAPKYYTTGTAIRCYGGNTFTVTSTNDITKIEFTFASGEGSNVITADQGTYADNVWTGSANSVTFTIGGTSGHRRLQVLDVTVSAGGDTPTPGEDPVHASYAIEGSYPTEFTIGDVFSHDGAVIYDVMSDNSKSDITAQCVFVAPDMTTAGNKTVSVELLGGEILTYNITVSEAGTPQPSAATAVDIVGVSGNYDATVNGETAVKLGTSSKGGSFSITVPANATKLSFYCAAWKGVNDLSLVVTPTGVASPESIALTPDDGISNNSPFTLSGNASSFLHELTLNLTAETTLTFTAAKRCVAWGASYEVAAGSIAAPVIDGEVNFIGSTEVNITCATDGAAIYYTLDGSEPTAESTAYTAAFTINETTTVKAIAVKDDQSSTVANKTFTKLALMTCAEASALAKDGIAALNEVQVVYVNGSNIYIQDESGAALIYNTNNTLGLAAGDIVNGFIGKSSPHYGLPELVPTVTASELTIVHGEAPAPAEMTVVPVAADVNKYVVLKNASVAEGAFVSTSATNLNAVMAEDTIVLRNNFRIAYTFEADKTYDIVGCVAIYNTTVQVYFISAEEVEEVIPVEPAGLQSVSGSTSWDFSKIARNTESGLHASNGIKLTDTSDPSKNEEIVYANYAEGQLWTLSDGFDGTTMAFTGEYPTRDNNYCQAGILRFNTTIAGTIIVKFSDTGSSASATAVKRYLVVNGEQTEYWTSRENNGEEPYAAQLDVVTEPIAVAAGDVTITGSSAIRVYTVTFTVGGSTPTALDKAEVEQQVRKVIENGQLLILRDGKAYGVDGRLVR